MVDTLLRFSRIRKGGWLRKAWKYAVLALTRTDLEWTVLQSSALSYIVLLSSASAEAGYQAFFPAWFWPCTLIYSQWTGPPRPEMKASLVLLLWLPWPGTRSAASLTILLHSPHQSRTESTMKMESNLFTEAFPSLGVSPAPLKGSWVLSSGWAHKGAWEWQVQFKDCTVRRTWLCGIYSFTPVSFFVVLGHPRWSGNLFTHIISTTTAGFDRLHT